MLHALRERARRHGEEPALWTKRHGAFLQISWRRYAERVQQVGLGLESLGVRAGGTLAILSSNREEWLYAQLGAMGVGARAVGLLPAATAKQLEQRLAHCAAQLLVVEDAEHAALIAKMRPRLPHLAHVIRIEGEAGHAHELTFDALLERGDRDGGDRAWNARIDGIDGAGPASIVYTAGTTGAPKAVVLSHHNLCWTAARMVQATSLEDDDVLLSHLPLPLATEQLLSVFAPLLAGAQVYLVRSGAQVEEALPLVRPTVFFGVPQLWEGLEARAAEDLEQKTPRGQRFVSWARRLTLDRTGRELRHEWTSLAMEAQHLVASRLLFERLRRRLGFDRTRLFLTSTAPTSRRALDFFASMDIVLREVYGLAETAGALCVNTEEHTKLGTVGRPLLGVEVRIAEDGEVLVRGGNTCLGYLADPRASRSLFSSGWLHTGDLGELDAEGFLRLRGRKDARRAMAG